MKAKKKRKAVLVLLRVFSFKMFTVVSSASDSFRRQGAKEGLARGVALTAEG